ncbi:MAG: NUDIX hydrolase [Waddliaceae bacterium]
MTKMFKGPRFDVDRIILNGHAKDYVVHPGAVVILPFLKEGEEVLLIKNKRFAVNKTLWELPAGTLEKGEEPMITAGRELEEETGYKASSIHPLLHFYTTPGFCNEKIHAFVASDLEYIGQKLDPTEEITVHGIPFEKTLLMIDEGEIIDGKTISTLLYYEHLKRRSGSL